MALGLGIVFIALALGAVGQIFLKTGVNSLGDGISAFFIIKSIFTTPTILLGFVCYGLSSLFYLVALSKLDLSYAYPMIALSYVIVALLSYKYLGEPLTVMSSAGLAVIILGVCLVAFGKPADSRADAGLTPPAIEMPGELPQSPKA